MVVVHRFGGPKRQKVKQDSFTAAKRQRFLDELASSCNVKGAARHADVHWTTVYRHRAQDEVFAGQWDDALQIARDRLEEALLAFGAAALPLEPSDGERSGGAVDEGRPFDLDAVLKILAYFLKKREVAGNKGKVRKAATREETNAVLLSSLAAAQRRLARISPDGR